jgi:hypothetical protein
MTDGMSEKDVNRVDQHVDPTAVTASEIEDSLNDDFDSEARSAFADALEQQREPVREEAREMLNNRLSTNPASGETQLRNSKGQFSAKASEVVGSPEISDDSGRVTVETTEGTVDLGGVDVNAGLEGANTRDSEYSK